MGVIPAEAQQAPRGPEFEVNSYTTGGGYFGRIVQLAGGEFVVAWESLGSIGVDNDSYSIQARRFDSSGSPVGDDFQVNTYTTGEQSYPAIAAMADGGFLVVWQSDVSSGNDNGQGTSLQGQRYDADADPVGGEFQVNSYTWGDQKYPSIGVESSGDFVVTWESYGTMGGDGQGTSVQLRRFDAAGVPQAAEFQVNTYWTGDQRYPVVAMRPTGEFVIVWDSAGSSLGDGSGRAILGQRYDADAAPAGGEFQVNDYVTGDQRFPWVAMDDSGSFAVVWNSMGSPGTDTDIESVQLRLFEADGDPAAPQLQVNGATTGSQILPNIAMDDDGRFVVAWQGSVSTGNDASLRSIQARRYRADGSGLGAEFQVNTYVTGEQVYPSVGVDSEGNFLVAWSSFGSAGNDTDDASLQMRYFDGLFLDGFEAGGTARWSPVQP